MIIGIGQDIVSIARIEKALQTFGDKFMTRIFTPEEQALARKRANPAATLAKRFAAKEACAKALGCGLWRGVSFTDIGVANNAAGQPMLVLTGAALVRLQLITPLQKKAILHLTISDEAGIALAQTIIEAR